MDLLGKVVVLAVVLVIAVALFAIVRNAPSTAHQKSNATQAGNFVLTYFKNSPNFQGATEDIIAITPSPLQNGSYDVYVGIIYNATSPCPTVVEWDYDYPSTGLLPKEDLNLTSWNQTNGKCVLYSGQNSSIANIKLPAIAIVKAYIESQSARGYVGMFGYNNTHATAQFRGSFYYSAAPSPYNSTGYNDTWEVNFTARNANYSYYTVLNQSGNVLFGYTLNK